MIKGGGSQSDSRLPLSSPLQESSLSGSGTPNLVAFSLLGPQMKKFTSPQQQQSHHQSSNAEFLQFPLSGNSQHNHQQSQPHQREPKVLGMFQNSRQPPNVGQSFGQQQQQFSGQMAAAKQGSLQDNTTNHLLGGGMSVQVLMNGLAMLQQKVQQLQALVPLLTQSVHGQSNASVVIAQQQAASAAVSSILAELVAAANSMLPQHVPAAAAVQQSNKVPNLELSQLLGAGTNNQNLNFFQQSGLDSPLGTSLGTSLGDLLGNKLFGNSFLSPDGLERSGFGGTGGVGGGGESGLGNDGHGFGNGGGSAGSEVAWHKELAGQQHVAKDESSKGMLRVQKENLLEKPHSNGHGVGRSGGIQIGSHGMSGSAAGSSLVGNNAVGAHHESRGMSTARPEEHDASFGADEDDGVVENLTPGSYDLVEMDAMEILAEHTHFCEICGKGFKRDANLRMHMRGHGDEYKTPAALAKPEKASNSQLPSVARPRRYSCPYMGCKRNKKHRKFLPLKTMLCVKNHYRRSHCPKMLTCTKCNLKKFSVVADLKTHEKHCGRDKWQCSCGTTFSRKDKLFGHVSLFAGHTPATPMDVEMEEGNAPLDAEFSAHGNNSRAAGFMSGSATGTHFASHVGGSRRGSEKGSEMGRMSSAGDMGLQLGAGGISNNNHDTSPPASSYSQNAMLQGLFTNTFL